MADEIQSIARFLDGVHPYDSLAPDARLALAARMARRSFGPDAPVYRIDDPLEGLYLIESGAVEVRERSGAVVSVLGARNSFGERGLLRDGRAATEARTTEASVLLVLPAAEFARLMADEAAFARFFTRARAPGTRPPDLAALRVGDLMARAPVTCAPETPIAEAARIMRAAHVSSLGVVRDGALVGLVTIRDLANRVLAEGRDPAQPIAGVMTPDPLAIGPDALGSDVLNLMFERGIGHLPIVEGGRLVGMVTQTDITRVQALSSAALIREIAGAQTVAQMAAVTARIPQLLVHLVGANHAHQVVTRLVTDIADAVTRRLIAQAEAALGPPPVPYLWLACGSQGRQEQTGVSDQDNCLIIDDAATDDDMAYFADLARAVCTGLDACGYVFCPGEMMATTPRWRVRRSAWRDYFARWIAVPNPEAQMLASVMFDLRPIGGTAALFADLNAETLDAAARNSIFVAHMTANALKHAPPLGLMRGIATLRSGEHRNTIDLKHNGVVPVADLGRIYALLGRLAPVNTRARLVAAEAAGIVSATGARELIEAYDLIAGLRLGHQAARVRAGLRPDNFLAPATLSDLERSHLRDAFVVVRTMQSALAHARGAPS